MHCIYCGPTDVSRKSRKPRLKKYVDEDGQVQTVKVYRYYCHNPKCKHKSFTNLPSNLLPYSKRPLEQRVAVLQMAALFGVVRSSGVVGIDEKYVLVPKSDKPDGKMKKWMYVYFAKVYRFTPFSDDAQERIRGKCWN